MIIDHKNQDGIAFGTSIQDIEVPATLKIRVKTGLRYMDNVLGGEGFTPSMVTLFTGTPGAGKTTMMLTLANSLQGLGCQVVFNTAEESLYQIKMTCDRLKLKNEFLVGGTSNVTALLKGCDGIRKANPKKRFFLIIDSLQCMNDGHFKSGRITTASAERSLQMLTSYAKEHSVNIIVIGQVTKDGKMAGSNKLKHMVDSFIKLSRGQDHPVYRKDEDLSNARILETLKNRFGGCGHTVFLALRKQGFKEIATLTAS